MSSHPLTDIVACVANSNLPWLSYATFHLYSSLLTLSYDVLQAAYLQLSPHLMARNYYSKMSCVDIILDHFDSC